MRPSLYIKDFLAIYVSTDSSLRLTNASVNLNHQLLAQCFIFIFVIFRFSHDVFLRYTAEARRPIKESRRTINVIKRISVGEAR